MNTFFDYLEDPSSAVRSTEAVYRDYLSGKGGLV